jgi:hypothetical protein
MDTPSLMPEPMIARFYRRGTCGRRENHEPHVHVSTTLGTFWCGGDPRAFGIAWNERVR